MLVLLSPAKKLDESSPTPKLPPSQPALLEDAQQLVELLRTDHGTADALAELMGLSDKLAELNAERYQQFRFPHTADNARPALATFAGDSYTHLAGEEWEEEDWRWAQDHLRILSGLYGVLRPLDLIQPYRLEMGTKLENPRGDRLYDFWGTRIAETLREALEAQEDKIVVNLASNEYFKSVDRDALGEDVRVVEPTFKDYKKDKYKIVSFYAKRARGAMADAILRQRVDSLEHLKSLEPLGYHFDEEGSQGDDLLFLRRQEP